MKFFSALIVLPLMLAPQQVRDPSNQGATSPGTASVTGTVITDEQVAQPIRRARVQLASTDGSIRRSDTTDDAGGFAFRDLPAGRYSLSSSKPAWLTTNFGATRPTRPGTPIAVADGARVTGLTLRMPRGAVITGVVRDATGQPAQGVRVQVSKLVMRNGERFLDLAGSEVGGPIETDDTGTYRLYGLPPGDVIVSAVVQSTMVTFRGGTGAFQRMTPDLYSRALQLAQQGQGELPMSGPPVKLAMVFYPGTTDPNIATVLTLATGEERTGIDLMMQVVATSSIEGVVTDATGAPPVRSTVVAVSGGIQLGGLMGLNGVTSGNTDSAGHYKLTGLAPGDYTVMASAADKMWAETAVSVNGQDLNVPLTFQPFLAMTGRVVFDGATPPSSAERIRYSVNATGGFASLLSRATTGTVINGTFTGDIVPGKYQLAFTGVPAGWYPKSAIARGQDVFDLPIVVGPSDRVTDFVVTFTDKPSELAGSLADAIGRPASEYFVVIFSTDQRFWTQPSRRIVQARPASDGAFSVKGLPAGDYFIAALTDIEPGESPTAELLTSIVAAAPPVQVKIVDGQRTVQALKIGGS